MDFNGSQQSLGGINRSISGQRILAPSTHSAAHTGMDDWLQTAGLLPDPNTPSDLSPSQEQNCRHLTAWAFLLDRELSHDPQNGSRHMTPQQWRETVLASRWPMPDWRPQGWASFLKELDLPEPASTGRENLPPRVAAVLSGAQAVEWWLASLPYGLDSSLTPLDTVVATQMGDQEYQGWGGKVRKAAASLQQIYPPRSPGLNLQRLVENLPVRPQTLQEVFRLLTRDQVHLGEVAQAATRDPKIAGAVIDAANAAVYVHSEPLSDLMGALAYIGLEAARRVLAACSCKPLFSTPELMRVWNHSLDAAGICEELARETGVCSPAEGFLMGLVHDVGLLALEMFPGTFQDRLRVCLKLRCEPVAAETVLIGFDHAELSARILQLWSFPASIVDAVRLHHRPEASAARTGAATSASAAGSVSEGPSSNLMGDPLACLLYLTEYLTGEEEDVSSLARMHLALKSLRLDPLRFSRQKRSDTPVEMRALRIVA